MAVRGGFALTCAWIGAVLLASVGPSWAQTAAARVPVTFTVTAVGDGASAPPVSRSDVQLFVGGERQPVDGWTRDDELTLAILIDDAIARDAAGHWNDLRQLIMGQPATTRIAVGYLRDNVTTLAQDFTADHAKAAAALRSPAGVGRNSNPYRATLDLVRRWPHSGARRSVLLISPGVDFSQGERSGPVLRAVDPLIEAAQAQNANVWAVFFPGGGHRGRSFTHVVNGQENLARLAEATGGELCAEGPGMPRSLKPCFDEIAAHLGSQYLLSFTAAGGATARHVGIEVTTERPDAELLGPAAVPVPAAH